MRKLRRLRDLREDSDLTQREVADILKTSPQYYQKYENGVRPLTIDRLIKLAEFYKTSVDYILERTDIKTPYPKK
ncbi:MAG: XRE family transcriptional regulator [Clostridia bacterium]|nr:XRE family transcriptional regulator [Clostridia bacterium]